MVGTIISPDKIGNKNRSTDPCGTHDSVTKPGLFIYFLSSPFLLSLDPLIFVFPHYSKPLSFSLKQTLQVKLANETEEASPKRLKSMDGTSVPSPVGDDVESRPEKESAPTVPPGFDAFSRPSTSTYSPPDSPEIPDVIDADDFGTDYNDDNMQGVILESSVPYVGTKVDKGKGIMPSSPTNVIDTTDTYVLSPASSTGADFGECSVDYDAVGEVVTSSSFNHDAMEEDEKIWPPIVNVKEPLSALADEYESGSSIMLQKIKLLCEEYAALRRIRGDGNCFFRSFMFSYLEHILMTQDRNEVERVLAEIEQCGRDLGNLGYTEFTYDDFFNNFTELLQNCLQGTNASLSMEELLEKACDQVTSDCAVMFLRFVASSMIQKRAEYFAPYIYDMSVLQYCKKSVEPMGEESEMVHIIAVCFALGVPIRVVYLDCSISGKPGNPANHHDFYPLANENGPNTGNAANVSPDISDKKKSEKSEPFVILLYRPGHYDILYPI